MELKVDKERLFSPNRVITGIYVRAVYDGKFDSYDIDALTKKSLLEWLRSRGGDNPWAEDVVGILLGHGHLHEQEED